MHKPLSKRQQRLAALPPMPANKGDISVYYRPKLNTTELQDPLPGDEHKYRYLSPEKKGIIVARVVARQKRIKNATPLWADKDLIREKYIQAQIITKETGIKHEVDHIVPIKHHLVCGLHNQFNLQILTETENIQKSNIFEV